MTTRSGPLPNTLVDFWRMIWECETTVIVMACNESESGKYKCESYWPQSPDEEQQYGNITGMSHAWSLVTAFPAAGDAGGPFASFDPPDSSCMLIE